MYQSGARTNRLAAGEGYFLDTVVVYGHLAPHKLRLDEFRERALADAALAQLPTDGSSSAGRMPLAALRQRLGQALVLLGTRLQQVPAATASPQG